MSHAQVGPALTKVSSIDEKKTLDDEHLAPEEYIPNSENVTKHEYDTLRHVGDHLPITAWLVVIVEFAERYAVPLPSRKVTKALPADGPTMAPSMSLVITFVPLFHLGRRLVLWIPRIETRASLVLWA